MQLQKSGANTVAERIGRKVPQNGCVSIFFITDAQFSQIRTFYGGKVVKDDVPEQGLLFL